MAYKFKNLGRFNWKLALLVGLSVILIVSILELTNTTHLFHKQTPSTDTVPSASVNKPSNQVSKKVASTNTAHQNKPSADKADTATSGVSSDLVAPYGTFVSNHKPSLSDTSSQEESVCITTPGASCYISFSNGSMTKKLEAKIADSRGAVYWSWNVNNAGLDAGQWLITATASAGSSTKSATDSLKLEVRP